VYRTHRITGCRLRSLRSLRRTWPLPSRESQRGDMLTQYLRVARNRWLGHVGTPENVRGHGSGNGSEAPGLQRARCGDVATRYRRALGFRDGEQREASNGHVSDAL